MKYKFSILLIIIILFLALNTYAYDNKTNYYDIYVVNYDLNTETIEINYSIPVIIGMKNKEIQNKYNKLFREKIFSNIYDLYTASLNFFYETKIDNIPFHKFYGTSNFQVKNRKDILSILINYDQYTGGAHGMRFLESYNINLNTGNEISLDEFLSITDLNIEKINKYILKEIKKKAEIYFSKDMRFISISRDQNYYIENNTIVIYFQLYKIAPYVTGFPKFKIPFKYNRIEI